MAEVGELCEVRGELIMEWKIKNFSSLPDEKDVRYVSPKFYFSGMSWILSLYPNGHTIYDSEDWISLFLVRMAFGYPVPLEGSIGLKTADGKTDPCLNFTHVFDTKDLGYGAKKLISKSALMKRKTSFPSDELTVICTMKRIEPNVVAGTLFSRLQTMSDNLKEIYVESKKTDCELIFDGEKISAHRMILETQSPVFAAMFDHDTKEKQTGEIVIEDIDKSTMDDLLVYMYSGDFRDLTTENALSIYDAAEKYDVKDVKEICEEFIIRNLSVEWVCDVMKFAELYKEEKISNLAKEYFKENAGKIVDSEKWKTFVKENPHLGVELLGSLVTVLLPK